MQSFIFKVYRCMIYKIEATLNVKVMSRNFSCCFTWKKYHRRCVDWGSWDFSGKMAGLRARTIHLSQSCNFFDSPIKVLLFDFKYYSQPKQFSLVPALFFFLSSPLHIFHSIFPFYGEHGGLAIGCTLLIIRLLYPWGGMFTQMNRRSC